MSSPPGSPRICVTATSGLPDRGLGLRRNGIRRPRGRRISFRDFSGRRRAANDSRGADKAELLQGSYPIVEADFLEDSTILEFQHGGAGEFHFATGVGRQRSDEEIAEGRPCMGSAAFPSADDVIAFRNQIRGAPEVEIGKRFAKVRHKGLDVFSATARFVKRILQQHAGCGEFIDNSEVAGLAPKIREPPANNSLVIFLLRQELLLLCMRSIAVRDQRTFSKVDFDGGGPPSADHWLRPRDSAFGASQADGGPPHSAVLLSFCRL